ncbi:MAG: hypothetical protein ACRCT7_18430, partial [Shewanella sp.]
LMPHGAQSPVILSLPDHLDAYGELQLVAANQEANFSRLSATATSADVTAKAAANLVTKPVWTYSDMLLLASYAKRQDTAERADADILQQ